MTAPQFTFLEDLPLTRRAVAFAIEHHGGQTRAADGAPALLHPLEVAALLARSGQPDHVVAAAVLHDVLEDTDAQRRELDADFGSEVGEIVATVSDDPAIEAVDERKADIRERVRRDGESAAVVYAADKVSKVRELRLKLATDGPSEESRAKLGRYRDSLAMLEQRLPGEGLVALLRFELEALEEFPPEPVGDG